MSVLLRIVSAHCGGVMLSRSQLLSNTGFTDRIGGRPLNAMRSRISSGDPLVYDVSFGCSGATVVEDAGAFPREGAAEDDAAAAAAAKARSEIVPLGGSAGRFPAHGTPVSEAGDNLSLMRLLLRLVLLVLRLQLRLRSYRSPQSGVLCCPRRLAPTCPEA